MKVYFFKAIQVNVFIDYATNRMTCHSSVSLRRALTIRISL